MENRIHFTDPVAYNTCIGNCCGVKDLKAACCYLDPDDIEHVLGPLDEEWISGFVKHLRKQGLSAGRHDVVIDFEEGKLIGEKFFRGHPVFQSPDSYPILRIQAVGPRFACKFLNFETGKCTIYNNRPNMCRDYLCQYIRANFLVRTKAKPNTYQKLR
jgi:Fe-S-cluster containining protein